MPSVFRTAAILVPLLLWLAAPASLAETRMYQWVDPVTGTTHLSGRPPAWYRAGDGGPRTFVFEDGRLVDDTARALPEDARRALRERAFRHAGAGPALAPALGAREDTGETEEVALTAEEEAELRALLGSEPALPGRTAEQRGEEGAEERETIARLKALIEAWDRRQTERAREVLEQRVRE